MPLQELSLVLGIFAVACPLWLSYKFFGTNKLGNASGLMYLGEAFGMSVTWTFAYLGYSHILESLSGDIQSIMRITMFLAAIATSIVLHTAVKSIVKGDNGD